MLGLHLLPFLQSFLIDKSSAEIVGAAKLDCVGLPERSLRSTMPYKNETEAICQSDLLKRTLLCIPLLGCFGAARAIMTTLINRVRPIMVPFFVGGSWTSGTGETVDLRGPIYHVPFMDKLFKSLIFCFLPSITGTDQLSCFQMRSFITDLGPVFGVWMLESYRNCPLLAGIAFQLKGIGIWAPIYYTLEYLHAPHGSLLSGCHEIAAQHTVSLLLALLGGLYLPKYLDFTSAMVESRRFWNAVWQPFPVIVPTIARVIRLLRNPVSKAENSADLAQSMTKPSKRNIFWVRAAYIGFAAISGFTWIHSICSAPANSSVLPIFWPGLDGHLRPVASFMDGIARYLQYDQIFAMGSGFVWLGLRLHELRQSEATFLG
ncbi:monooxygenase [Penicillium waksmanii]|uniref:monooxygenase n=1 Tax=Penicillium waksmanii TaxID=69791 RepID=UPI002547611C|nr:monooxygenase [Penicillium waksmanii]KAJ5980535.1 monooxygenase [Penicillium waksmanii]